MFGYRGSDIPPSLKGRGEGTMRCKSTVSGFCVGGLYKQQSGQKPAMISSHHREFLPYHQTCLRSNVCMRSSANEFENNGTNDGACNDHHGPLEPDDIADQEEEDSLIRELRDYIGKESTSQDKEHLDLLWSVSSSVMTKNASVDFKKECTTCRGTGEIECQFCHGTGALTIGDMLFCDNTGCRQCPVCSGGTMKCATCKGTGHYASWMKT